MKIYTGVVAWEGDCGQYPDELEKNTFLGKI